MFSGIVEGRGRVRKMEKAGSNVRLVIDMGKAALSVRQGDSISINGVCLSAVSRRGRLIAFDTIAETLRKTNLGALRIGSPVNYERSMKATDLIGGHLVTGHIDGTGVISEVTDENGSIRMVVTVPEKIGSTVLEKGLVAVDGISLTPAEVTDSSFTLYLIPDTLKKTTMSARVAGDKVNIELDLFGKYIERFVSRQLRDRVKGKKA